MTVFQGFEPLNQDLVDLFLQMIAEGKIPESYGSFLDNAEWVQGSDLDDEFWITDPDPLKSRVVDSGDGLDHITTGKGDDVFFGGSGRDVVSGQTGDDVLFGGEGRDVLNGYHGDDIIVGGDGNDVLLGWLGDDVLYGGSGNDSLSVHQGSNTMFGGDGDDLLLLESWAGEPEIAFSPGATKIEPTEPLQIANVLSGGAGADTFLFRWLIDATAETIAKHTVDGVVDWRDVAFENEFPHQHWVETMGNDVTVVDFDPSTDNLVFEGHTIELTSIEYVDADGDGAIDDTIVSVHSNNGNNITHHLDDLGSITFLNSIVSSENIDINTAVYYGVSTWWEPNTFGPDRDTIALDSRDVMFFLNKLKNSEFQTLPSDDILEASWLQGDEMDNHLHGLDLSYQVLDGGLGDDTLHGRSGDDVLFGGEGNDSLSGSDGSDYLLGGAGDDYLSGGLGSDFIWGRDGTDTLSYEDSSVRVKIDWRFGAGYEGSAEGDRFFGIERVVLSNLDDVLHGTESADDAAGLGGNDFLKGYDGNDLLSGGGGQDILNGGAGADTLDGGDGRDWAYFTEAASGVSVDLSIGSGLGGEAMGDVFISIENLRGSTSADLLKGDDTPNLIYGGAGDDVIEGGAGNDVLSGGQGNDQFVFHSGDGHDWIVDFDPGVDQLIISNGNSDFSSVNVYDYAGTSVVNYSDGGYVLLPGVDLAEITEGIFDFI